MGLTPLDFRELADLRLFLLELRDRQGVIRLDSVMFSTQQVPEMSLAGPAVLVSVCIAKAMRRAGR